MELQLRVIFLVVGLLVLLGVAIDVFRRRPERQNAIAGFLDGEPEEQLLRSTALEPDMLETYMEEGVDPELDKYHDHELNLELDFDNDNSFNSKPEPLSIKNVIVIFIMSRDPKGFNGGSLHDALSNAHFHIGKNNIFYRYEQDNGTGEQLFSLAKALEPGYFDIDTLRQEFVPGVTLIMLTKKLKNPDLALDKLIRAAKQISFVLNGELLDHTHQALTLTTIDGYREQLKSS